MVWLTTWPGTDSFWEQHWGLSVGEKVSAGDPTNTYGATIAVGPIVLRTYASFTDLILIAPGGVDGIHRIWPNPEPFDWRAVFHLTEDELRDFAFEIPRALEQMIGDEAGLDYWAGKGISGPIYGPGTG